MAIEQNQNYTHTGDIEFQGGIKITTAPTNGHVLTSDVDGNASWQASGSGVVQSVTRTLTSAEILALHTTPIELVAAQGAGTAIMPIRYFIWTDSGTVYATDVTATITIGGASFQNMSVFGANDSAQWRVAMTTISVSPVSSWVNAALEVTTPTSNPTAGTLEATITVFYSVINL